MIIICFASEYKERIKLNLMHLQLETDTAHGGPYASHEMKTNANFLSANQYKELWLSLVAGRLPVDRPVDMPVNRIICAHDCY